MNEDHKYIPPGMADAQRPPLYWQHELDRAAVAHRKEMRAMGIERDAAIAERDGLRAQLAAMTDALAQDGDEINTLMASRAAVADELDAARRWARAWKRAAKKHSRATQTEDGLSWWPPDGLAADAPDDGYSGQEVEDLLPRVIPNTPEQRDQDEDADIDRIEIWDMFDDRKGNAGDLYRSERL